MGLEMQMLKLILVMGAILALAFWSSRYLGRRLNAPRPGSRLKVLEQIPCGRDVRLMLVEWEGRQLLIGSGPGGLTLLAEAKAGEGSGQKEAQEDFMDALKGGRNNG